MAVGAAIGPRRHSTRSQARWPRLPALLAALAARGTATAAAARAATGARRPKPPPRNAVRKRRPQRRGRARLDSHQHRELLRTVRKRRRKPPSPRAARSAKQGQAAADHERLADRALGHQLRRSARTARRRPLHRRADSPGGHAAERLVGAQRAAHSRARPRCRTPAAGAAAAAAALDRPAALPGRRGRAHVRLRHAGAADDGRRIPEGDPSQITATAAYREHGLIVDHLRHGRPAPRQPACRAGASSATLTSQPPAGALAALALRAARALRSSHDLQPDFTQAEPRKAPALTKNTSTNERRPPLHAFTSSPPQSHWLARRDRGLCSPCCSPPRR